MLIIAGLIYYKSELVLRRFLGYHAEIQNSDISTRRQHDGQARLRYINTKRMSSITKISEHETRYILF
jgi:hypothetical protein